MWEVNPTICQLYTQERDQVPLIQEAGWTSGQVRMSQENLAPHGFRRPDSPSSSKLLYWTPAHNKPALHPHLALHLSKLERS